MMDFAKLLSDHKSGVLKRWQSYVINTYKPETAQFFEQQKDRFANPVGHSIHAGTEKILEGLISGKSPDQFRDDLDGIIKVRAVQEFCPSEAVAFLFLLKNAVRKELSKFADNVEFFQQLLEFEGKIDAIALHAFDMHMGCREKVYELRANELRRRVAKTIERINTFDERHGKTAIEGELDNVNGSNANEGGGK